MVTPSYSITCSKKQLIAPGVYELRFSKPDGFSFRAGQFVLFDVPLISNASDIQPRAYSIASSPSEHELIFVVKVKEGGRFGEWLTRKLDKGSSLMMKGPFGLFTLNEKPHHFIFAATGAGIAPFRSHINDALEHSDTRQIDLFFGVRHHDDLFWTDEFTALSASHTNFKVHLCLSGDNKEWKGNHGRIQTFIPSIIKDPLSTELYICGAPEMVKDIKALALENWKLPKANVHGEGYI